MEFDAPVGAPDNISTERMLHFLRKFTIVTIRTTYH